MTDTADRNPPVLPPGRELDAETQRFYAHLDRCSQCRNHPFNLCVLGGYLLRDAATASGSDPFAGLGRNKRPAGRGGQP